MNSDSQPVITLEPLKPTAVCSGVSLDLLISVAHPDDEAYGTAGTFAEYSSTGRRTGLITMTRGGSGRSLGLCEPQDLPAFREAELRASIAAIGIHELRLYDYPDAAPPERGAPGSPTTPGTFLGGLQDVNRQELEDRVLQDLLELQPKVVITFAPDGSNRHPDHIVSSAVTVAAFERAGLEATGSRLYFFASPVLYNPEWADTWRPPTHARDVTAYLPQKLRSIAAHRTQALSTIDFLSRMAERIPRETFRRAIPAWTETELSSEL
jgi:N-acetylglucosamine malate deacetylase 2